MPKACFMEMKKIDDVRFEIEKDIAQGMTTGVRTYMTEHMIKSMKTDRTLQQAVNTTTLPGIAGEVLIMPDGHEGYGFPVGGVVAFDEENGIISPGINGFDIGCGIRIVKTNMVEEEVRPVLGRLLDEMFKNIPSGVGSKFQSGLSTEDLKRIAEEGVNYLIGRDFGTEDDAKHIEENGSMAGADFDEVSASAKKRGLHELGTLGAGNHFVEIQKIGKVYDKGMAKSYGLFEDQIVVMIHTGSRGFGHQICSDYLMRLEEYRRKNNIKIVDPELSYAKIGSKEANSYLYAMHCGINFAFSNRQIITNSLRKSFENVFGKSSDAMGMDILYDLAHNIIKKEEHVVDGKRMNVWVHRKGATRAFPKGHKEVPKKYRDVGQPVLIPGSMGTASYVLAGDEGSMKETFGSSCHGAGRVMSRHQAIRDIPASKTFGDLSRKGIEIRIRTMKLISEEAEWAYKDVDEVVSVVEKARISKIVTKNIPVGVAKG